MKIINKGITPEEYMKKDEVQVKNLKTGMCGWTTPWNAENITKDSWLQVRGGGTCNVRVTRLPGDVCEVEVIDQEK